MGIFERVSVAGLKEAYLRGENIMALLATDAEKRSDGFDTIQTAYDLQASSYTAAFETPEGARLKAAFAEALTPHLDGYSSMLDAGAGEATTLVPVLDILGGSVRSYGFDVSISRLLWARRNLLAVMQDPILFVGNTEEIPLRDASVELVPSVHSIEPNGGREQELLTELLRVAARRLVLVEPTTAYASDTQLEQMRALGYCTNLPDVLVELGADVVLHEPWPVNGNPDNAAEIIVVDVAPKTGPHKQLAVVDQDVELVAPSSLATLEALDGGLYSRDDGLYFPVVGGFPVLSRNQAVVATQLLDGV